MSAFGIPTAAIARSIGVEEPTLFKYYGRVLQDAAHEAADKVARTLYQKALAGHVICMLFYLKCRAGWREGAELVIRDEGKAREDLKRLGNEDLEVLHALLKKVSPQAEQARTKIM
jgi:hypothetical protein